MISALLAAAAILCGLILVVCLVFVAVAGNKKAEDYGDLAIYAGLFFLAMAIAVRLIETGLAI